MRWYDAHWLMEGVARQMWREGLRGFWDGVVLHPLPYFERCKAFHTGTASLLIFTRDIGMHASGFLKNPDYERCYHLSLSFKNPLNIVVPAPRDVRLSRQWVEAFYHDNRKYVWAEPPFSEDGKRHEVWHYRVFCDEDWQPILPRGEVYSREFTERGWKSFSDLGWEIAKQRGEYMHSEVLNRLVNHPK